MPDPRTLNRSAASPSLKDQEAKAMCRVLNEHHAGVPAGAVYIGRGS
jgi:hypothetical protein